MNAPMSPPASNAAPVLFEERTADNGMRLGLATLNKPQSLNGLSLPMVDLLHAQLREWASDPSVAAVILQGAGEKAFCAGGDLQSLYQDMQAHKGQGPLEQAYARDFFEREYRLDYFIHTYPKPVLCWGRGIVMGGGVGLMMGASHRVFSTDARVAMPEVTIGLFPDVGASWLMNRMPGRAGLFLALTGAQLNAADAIYAGMGEFRMPAADWPAFLNDLLHLPWAGGLDKSGPSARSANDGLLRQAIQRFEPKQEEEPGPLKKHAALIDSLCGEAELDAIVEKIATLAEHQDPWLARAARTMLAGSPGSLRLAFGLQHHTRTRSLADVFRIEYVAGLHCAAHGDLQEGIRALLIDKDKTPRWNPATLREADEAWFEPFLREPWPEGQPHPLADLGK